MRSAVGVPTGRKSDFTDQSETARSSKLRIISRHPTGPPPLLLLGLSLSLILMVEFLVVAVGSGPVDCQIRSNGLRRRWRPAYRHCMWFIGWVSTIIPRPPSTTAFVPGAVLALDGDNPGLFCDRKSAASSCAAAKCWSKTRLPCHT